MIRVATVALCLMIAVATTVASVGHAHAHLDAEFAHHVGDDGHTQAEDGGDDPIDGSDQVPVPTGDHGPEYHLVALIGEVSVVARPEQAEQLTIPERAGFAVNPRFRDPDPD